MPKVEHQRLAARNRFPAQLDQDGGAPGGRDHYDHRFDVAVRLADPVAWIWNRLIEPEKKGDPEKKGFGVLIKVERAEDLSGAPLAI